MSNLLEERTILIVDDASENVALLGEILKGYKKLVALSGEKALKIASGSIKPDLILLDVVMPDIDGFEVCRQLKAKEETKDIPIIFITSRADVEDETKGLELGAADFIPKPISPPIVIARVKNQLELLAAKEKLLIQNYELILRNKYITDSINYAEKIQHAILSNEETFKKIFPNSFLIFRPKDIISGDFYWIKNIKGKKFVAAVDCTGHGVPGSLMSMIGNTLLDEIITFKNITEPAAVLNELNNGIITELNKDVNIETFDGMDIALCVVDENEKTISFAGAYRPLYYFKNGVLEEVKGERKSIGDKKKRTEFKSHVIKYEDELVFYLFTDGLPDQNNERGNKFTHARFKTLLKNIQGESLAAQQKRIICELENHQKNEVQRDDITVIGISCNADEDMMDNKLIYSFSYEGLFSQSFLEEVVCRFEKEVKPLLPNKAFKTFIFCSTEFIQNVGYYSLSRANSEDGKEYGIGRFSVEIDKEKIKIKSVNKVSNSQFDRAMFRITHFNSLTKDELKKLKKEKMKSEREEDSRGGGIGFIEMVSRTGSKVIMNKELPPDKNLTLELIINYKIGDING